ncbi:MAG: DUF1684 domain-containing protein [Anaerolineae bacterium]
MKGSSTVPSAAESSLTAYVDALLDWRGERDKELRADNGWLTIIGLFWLEPGENSLGSAPESDVVLPERLPAHVGTLTLSDGSVTLKVRPGHDVRIGGELVQEAVLSSDDEHPTLVQIETVTFFVIRRGTRLAIRMRDSASVTRTTFNGRNWFSVIPDLRVAGRFMPHESHRTIEVETIIGTTVALQSPGTVTFELDDRVYNMDAFHGENDGLWFVFRDETSGAETYGGGRFLDAPLHNGVVDLDFNRAVHPPCAFTPFATCPLPPKENALSIRIEAGERWPNEANTH